MKRYFSILLFVAVALTLGAGFVYALEDESVRDLSAQVDRDLQSPGGSGGPGTARDEAQDAFGDVLEAYRQALEATASFGPLSPQALDAASHAIAAAQTAAQVAQRAAAVGNLTNTLQAAAATVIAQAAVLQVMTPVIMHTTTLFSLGGGPPVTRTAPRSDPLAAISQELVSTTEALNIAMEALNRHFSQQEILGAAFQLGIDPADIDRAMLDLLQTTEDLGGHLTIDPAAIRELETRIADRESDRRNDSPSYTDSRDVTEAAPPSNTVIQPPTSGNKVVIGSHEAVSETLLSDRCRVTGWAVDPDNPDRKVDIKIYAEGQLVGSLQANQYRNTLLNVCPGGACGFTFDLSPHIKKGQTYTIRTRAIDVNTAEEINLFDTPHNLRCVDPPPTLSLAPVLPVSITSNFIPYASVGISKSPQDPFTSNITVTRGVPTSIYLTARRSDDSNGWTHPQFGVSNGGRCEWNSDLNQGTPTFERTINNPASAQSCDISLGNLTFNDAPGTYTYQVLRIVDAAGAVSRTDTIRVRVENPPSASIFADGRDNAYTIPFGARDKTVNLNWGCSGFNLLPPDASGSWSGQKAFGGNERTPPLSPGIHTYTITCRDAQGGSASDTIVVTVEAPPAQVTVDLKANGQDGTLNLAYNSSATLSWTSSSNTTSCRAGGVWAGNKSSNGSESTGNLAPAVSRTYTYSLTCSDNHPSTPDATDTVHVSVQGWLNSFVTPSPPTPSPPPPPASTNRLPTGYHDGARGQVALSQCRAFGWATDPDDPSRPVNVGVRVGGGSFRTIVPANQFRQDLQNANVCPQGRCAFDIDLTPYISDSSSREVRVEALDLQNGTPTLLSNSPKAITCSQPVSPPPLTLTSSCPAPGTQATLSWTPVPGTHHYALRVNDLRDGWDGTCSSPNGDFCKDVFPLVYVFPSTPQTSYSWWVHPCNSAGVCGEAVNQQFVCASAPNRAPIADARIDTIQGAFTKPNNNTIAVTQGVPTPVYLSARFSNDPDNWTDPINGVSNGGRCEWNSDLNQGTPTFERIINNPASAQSCDTYLGNLTFNDAPGTYTYQVLRIVDRQGGASIGSVSVSVVRPAVVAPPPVTTGTIIIKRVGADETTGSAPQGSHARIDPFPLQSQNPVTFPNLATGNYTASVVDLPGFTETYGVCFYAPGSPECSVTAISSTPACNGTSCSLPFQIIAPFTRKVVVKYVPTPTRIGIPQPIITTSCVGTQPRATISWQNAQRPAGYWVDIDTDNNWNNGFWNKQVQSAITTLAPDGFNPGFGAQGPLPFASGSGYYVRVWYENTNEHSPTAAFNTPQCVPPQSIGTISIFRVDQSGNLFTAASTAGRVNQLSPQSQNPALFTNLPAAGYTISATDLREYTETYGVCNYAPGTPECTVNSFPITPACDGVFCSVSGQFLAAPLIRKVVFKYDLPIAVTPPPQSGTIIIKRVGADETTGSAPQGSHARIDPFPLQSQNPVTFPNLATGNYTASVVDLPGFTETYGVCFYAPGSPECSVTAISSTPACNGTSCSLPFQIIAPFTRKVVVKYTGSVQLPSISPSQSSTLSPSRPSFSHTLSLARGQNFISSPLIENTPTPLSSLQTTCGNLTSKINRYDNQKKLYTNTNTLTDKESQGYRITANKDCSITLKGDRQRTKDDFTNMQLRAGVNLIGAPNASIPFSQIKGSCTVTTGPLAYESFSYKTSSALNPGRGYLVIVQSDCTLGSQTKSSAPAQTQTGTIFSESTGQFLKFFFKVLSGR